MGVLRKARAEREEQYITLTQDRHGYCQVETGIMDPKYGDNEIRWHNLNAKFGESRIIDFAEFFHILSSEYFRGGQWEKMLEGRGFYSLDYENEEKPDM